MRDGQAYKGRQSVTHDAYGDEDDSGRHKRHPATLAGLSAGQYTDLGRSGPSSGPLLGDGFGSPDLPSDPLGSSTRRAGVSAGMGVPVGMLVGDPLAVPVGMPLSRPVGMGKRVEHVVQIPVQAPRSPKMAQHHATWYPQDPV